MITCGYNSQLSLLNPFRQDTVGAFKLFLYVHDIVVDGVVQKFAIISHFDGFVHRRPNALNQALHMAGSLPSFNSGIYRTAVIMAEDDHQWHLQMFNGIFYAPQ